MPDELLLTLTDAPHPEGPEGPELRAPVAGGAS